MRAAELGAARVAVWGRGREGRAAIAFLRQRYPNLSLVLLDDAAGEPTKTGLDAGIECAFGAEQIARALERADIIVKSPGVSLYRAEIQSALAAGKRVTSLLNLWFAEGLKTTTVCVTGTKGKSTTASLIAHILARLGRRVALVGNIGVPITGIDRATDVAVIEVSSYQAADFDGICDVAVLTSLYPEHIDWHLSVENYFRDKIHLLNRSRCAVLNCTTAEIVASFAAGMRPAQLLFPDRNGMHCRGPEVFDGTTPIGQLHNAYLARPHNRSNLCAALTVAKLLEVDPVAALEAASGFRALPHRQQELGEVGGVLYVDDSISTIPESTLAALAVYAGRDITVILGGHDRGVDYGSLVEQAVGGAAKAVICLGRSGERIYASVREAARRPNVPGCKIYRAKSMADAVGYARQVTPAGGVVLLSPASPSYGQYRDYIERGRDFAAEAGLCSPAEHDSHSAAE